MISRRSASILLAGIVTTTLLSSCSSSQADVSGKVIDRQYKAGTSRCSSLGSPNDSLSANAEQASFSERRPGSSSKSKSKSKSRNSTPKTKKSDSCSGTKDEWTLTIKDFDDKTHKIKVSSKVYNENPLGSFYNPPKK